MKLKGISPIEQNVEKMVLGVVALILLAVVVIQLMRDTTVKVGTQDRPIAQAFRSVEEDARRVDAKMNAPNPDLPTVTSGSLYEQFKQRLAQPVASKNSMAHLGGPVEILKSKQGPQGDAMYAMPVPPAPTAPLAYPFRNTIDPFEIIQSQKVAALVASEQPFDKSAVSVEGIFSGKELKNKLDEDPPGEARNLLQPWWRDSTQVMKVELERQRLLADGSWAENAIVPAMPERVDLSADLKNVTNLNDLTPILQDAAASVSEILRPDYYRTIAGPIWDEPSIALARDSEQEGSPEFRKLTRERDSIVASIDRIQRTLNQPGGRQPPPEQPRNRSGGGGGAAGGKGGGGGNRPPSAPSNNQPIDRQQQQREQLQRQLEDLQKRLDKNTADLTALGATIDAEGHVTAPRPGTKANSTAPGGSTQPGANGLFDDDAIKIWAHDVFVVPGETYRYRIRIVINNPLFGREGDLRAAQKDLAAGPLAPGEWSAWTAAVPVLRTEYFFVTNATETNPIGSEGPRATVEMYKHYYGWYRKAAVGLEQGDPIDGAASVPASCKIADLAKLAEPGGPAPDPARQGPVPPGGPAAPGSRDGRAPAPGPRGKGDAPNIPRPEAPGAVPGEKQPLDDVWKPGPKHIPVSVNAVFLDVARMVGSVSNGIGIQSDINQAYFALPDGSISIRVPDDDKDGEIYKAVATSYRKGEAADEIQRPKTDQPPNPVPPREPREQRRPQNPGGGGGGGGGGSGGS